MQKKLLLIIVLFLLGGILNVSYAVAGGGHFEMGPLTAYTYVNSPAEIRAVLHSPNDSTQFSVGEHVTFVISSPRSGDSCTPTSAVADSNGNVSSLCTAQTSGQISVHIHSVDYGDDSPNVLMTFDPVPQQPTATPVPTATPTPISYRSTSGTTPTLTPVVAKNSLMNAYAIASPTPIASSTATPTPVPTRLPTPTPIKKQLIQGLTAQNISIYVAGLILMGGTLWGLLHFLKRTKVSHPHEIMAEKIEKQQDTSIIPEK